MLRMSLHLHCLTRDADPRTLTLRRVVGDLMKNAGHRATSVVELDQYLRRPRSIGGRVQVGFQGLARDTPLRKGSGSILRCVGSASCLPAGLKC